MGREADFSTSPLAIRLREVSVEMTLPPPIEDDYLDIA
jgi:hypothetical protein